MLFVTRRIIAKSIVTSLDSIGVCYACALLLPIVGTEQSICHESSLFFCHASISQLMKTPVFRGKAADRLGGVRPTSFRRTESILIRENLFGCRESPQKSMRDDAHKELGDGVD